VITSTLHLVILLFPVISSPSVFKYYPPLLHNPSRILLIHALSNYYARISLVTVLLRNASPSIPRSVPGGTSRRSATVLLLDSALLPLTHRRCTFGIPFCVSVRNSSTLFSLSQKTCITISAPRSAPIAPSSPPDFVTAAFYILLYLHLDVGCCRGVHSIDWHFGHPVNLLQRWF
jgi:hypothetical protein